MLILRQSAGGSFSRTPRSPPRRIWNDLLVKSPGSSNSRPSATQSPRSDILCGVCRKSGFESLVRQTENPPVAAAGKRAEPSRHSDEQRDDRAVISVCAIVGHDTRSMLNPSLG
jgi:hypothetical protein